MLILVAVLFIGFNMKLNDVLFILTLVLFLIASCYVCSRKEKISWKNNSLNFIFDIIIRIFTTVVGLYIMYSLMEDLFNPHPLLPPNEPEDYLAAPIFASLFLYPVIFACIPKLSSYGREWIMWWGFRITISCIGGFFIYLWFPSIQGSIAMIIPVLLILYLIIIILTAKERP